MSSPTAPRTPVRGAVTTALVVAGGRGTRLQPLTHDVPKPLLPFCGAPFLEGVVDRLADAGVTRVFLVVGADTAPFAALAPAARELGVALGTVPEEEPLDTAGGVRAVADRFDGPVLVLNGDVLTDLDYAAIAADHLASGADATLYVHPVADTSPYGVTVVEDGRISRFVEKPPPGTLPGHDLVNAGAYVIEPRVLLAHPQGRLSFERQVFPSLLERGGHVRPFVWEGVWADLGTPDRYRAGHRAVLDGELEWPSLRRLPERSAGVRVADGVEVAGATLVAPAVVLAGATVRAGATVGPHAVVGREAAVGAGAVVSDVVLHDGVEVGADVVATGLVAGHDARVESGAVIGRDVVLGSGEVVAAGETLVDGERRPPPRG